MHKYKQIRADKQFVMTCKEIYKYKTMVQITKELNAMLEKLYFGAELNERKKR